MASIKEYNRKLVSLKNTGKITRTMKMVSASKLRRAQDAQRCASEFVGEINHLINRIVGTVDQNIHPLLTPTPEVKNILVVLFTSDKGLCGAFNNGIIRFLSRWIDEQEGQGRKISVACCGRRGYSAFKDSGMVFQHFENVTGKVDARNSRNIGRQLSEAFLDGQFDEILLVYNEFISALSQKPVVQPLLPLAPDELRSGEPRESLSGDFIAEPGLERLLDMLVPRIVNFKIQHALLENSAGEHGARMTAMDNANKNAKELTEKTTLLRNRARQAAITTELIEIISGAEAL